MKNSKILKRLALCLALAGVLSVGALNAGVNTLEDGDGVDIEIKL